MVQLQFVCENAISSQAIAWFSAGHFSHVDAVWGNGADLLGARSDNPGGYGKGVRARRANYLTFSRRVLFAIPATQEQDLKWQQFLNNQQGKPYDSEAIWAFLFNRNWREQDSWICSELQAAALEHAGIIPPLYLAANKITPVSLALAVSALVGVVVSEPAEYAASNP
jgi:uncharacterized protein YycO